MKTMSVCTWALCLSILGTQIAAAQELCRDNESRDACQFRVGNGEVDAAAAEVAADARSDVAAQNTGDNEASTTNDFLPLLRLLLDGDSLSDGQKIGFEWSDPLGFGSKVPNKLTVSAQDPEVYEPLKKSLQDAGLTDQVTALDDRIDAGDDLKIGFTLGLATQNYGRDPELHKALFAELLRAGRDTHDKPPGLQAAEDAIGRFLLANPDIDPDTTKFGEIVDPVLRAQYRKLAEAEIVLKNAWLKGLSKTLTGLGFEGLIQLIDNQPQLTFAIDYKARDEAVGPDEVAATLAWEFGGRSVRTFRDYAMNSCPQRVANDPLASQVACLSTYLDGAESANESFRFKLAAEYSELQRIEFELADPAFTFMEKRVKHLQASAGLSRQIGKPKGKAPRPRFDARLSYDDVSDDPARQDRGLASVTFSYPVSQGFFITLGALYATKPEYRGDVDEELSARVGLTYKLIEER